MNDINWPIQTEIPIQWGDMDAFSHVNNVIYIRWFETARIELAPNFCTYFADFYHAFARWLVLMADDGGRFL